MKTNKNIFPLLVILFDYYIMGFCDIVGFSTSYISQEFTLSETISGLIPSMVFLWFFLLSIPVAILMNKIKRKRTVILGNVITIVGMLLPMVHFSFSMCMVAFALLGIGNTILQVSLNPLLTNVIEGKTLTSLLTTGQVIKSISSFMGPFIATFALSLFEDWKMMFLIFAVLTVISTLLLLFTRIEETTVENYKSAKQIFDVLKDKKILLLFFGIIAIVGIDVGLNILAPKLLIERVGISVEQASYGSSIYFFCKMLGIFIGIFLLTKINDKIYYIIHSILGIAVLLLLFFAQQKLTVFILLGFTGYTFSSIFPVIYSLALKCRPEYANEISGLMITGVSGGAITPPLMGISADLAGSQMGSLSVITVLAIYLLICSKIYKTQ